MNEQEFRSVVESRLEKYFDSYPEQKGYGPGPTGKMGLRRIDLIIEHREHPGYVFGIEFKTNGRKRGADLAQFVNQAKAYGNIEWDFHTNAKRWGRVPVFICPPLSGLYLEYVDKSGHQHDYRKSSHHNVNSFLAGIGGPKIGEVRYKVGAYGTKYLNLCWNCNILWREMEFEGATIDFLPERTCEKQIGDMVYVREVLDSNNIWFPPKTKSA